MDFSLLTKITGLALGDSVNPCALAVLTMVLVAIMNQNPDKRKQVLFGGFAFVGAVFIGYVFYGIVLIELFGSVAQTLREQAWIFYNGLAILIMVIGALNIKDYFMYRPGGIATEMPIWMRPKVRELINGITSPRGAFIIGIFVTLFLLPCTIGPYIGASGELSKMNFVSTIPWLIYYNLLFVLPMIAIVGMVYYGFTKVEEVSGWKERNIRKLHLIAGSLLFLVGFSLLIGWL